MSARDAAIDDAGGSRRSRSAGRARGCCCSSPPTSSACSRSSGPSSLPALAGPATENHHGRRAAASCSALLRVPRRRCCSSSSAAAGMGPKAVALIGVLGAAMVALRLPGLRRRVQRDVHRACSSPATRSDRRSGSCSARSGCSRAGCSSAGSGPWLPFQMVAMGWVGLGAGPAAGRRRALARADPGARRLRRRRGLRLRRGR